MAKKKKTREFDLTTFFPPSASNVQPKRQFDVFNGYVSVEKYRVRVELVEESREVICARLQELWDTTQNSHHWAPLKEKAAEFNYELKGGPGNKRER